MPYQENTRRKIVLGRTQTRRSYVMNTTNRLAEISTVVSVVRSFGKHSVVQLKEGLCIFIGDKPSAGDMCAYAYEDTLIRINFIEVIGRAYSWDVETEVRAELKYEGKLRGFSSFRGLAIRNSDPNKRGLALSLKALAIILNPCCLQRVPAPRAPAHDFSAA